MKHSPLPWTAETYSKGGCIHEMMLAADGKCIFDTANSDRAMIETEHDPDGPGVDAWDAQGRADFEFILKAIEERGRLKKMIESAEAAIDGVDLQEGHIRDNCTPDELREKLLGAGIEIAEQKASFELRWNADMRAIKRWRDAHPGNELVQPDHADMVVWLLDELDRLRSETRSQQPVSRTGS